MEFLHSALPILLLLVRGLVVLCLIHAVVTRQDYYWMALLVFAVIFGGIFSTIGALVYAFTVFFPWLRGRGRVAGQAVARGAQQLRPLDARIRDAESELAESDTLEHRTELASLQARAGRLDEAQATLHPLLSGLYRDDPLVLLTSGQLDLARHLYAEAETKLGQVDLRTSAATRTRTLTLLAYAQAQQGKPEADATYRDALQGATSEEPRVRYAEYLIAQGRSDEAGIQLEALARAEQKASGLYRRQEREWFSQAAGLRRDLKAGPGSGSPR